MPKKKTSNNKKGSLAKVAKLPKIEKKVNSPKKVTTEPAVLSSSINLFKKSYQVIEFQRKFFGLTVLTYILLMVTLVINISAFANVSNLKNSYTHGLTTIGSNLSASLSTLGSLSGTVSGSNNSAGSVIQFLLFLLFSLILIRGVREATKSRKLKFSEGIYSSTYPFLQFVLVTLLLAVELIPVLIAVFIYQIVFNNGIASSAPEKIVWIIVCGLILMLGVYLLVSSIFAIFITTLPNMRPWASVKSSWKLVKNRRLLITRKILAMFLSLFLFVCIIALILIWLVPVISAWLLLILGIGSLVVIYTYMYILYKELI
jgi:hypothetical protein